MEDEDEKEAEDWVLKTSKEARAIRKELEEKVEKINKLEEIE